ncbi:MAG: hypothetical protein WAK37_18720, partial [Pseudolabrys sp.]
MAHWAKQIKESRPPKGHQQQLSLSVRIRSVILSLCLLEHLPCSDQLESFYRSLSEQIAYRVAFPLVGLTQARHHPTRY